MNIKTILILVLLILFFCVLTLSGNDFYDAIQKGDIAKVKTLMANNEDLINMTSEKGQTPLHCAAQNGHREIVEFLLARGADIDARDGEGNTPLLTALAQKKQDAAALLISKGADVRIKNGQKQPAVVLALMQGLNELVVPILDAGQDVNERFEGNITVLHMATISGNKDIVEILVDRGADADIKADEGGITSMFAALFLGHREILDIILTKSEVDRGFRDEATGRTYLHTAVLTGSKDIVDLLVKAGFDVNAADSGGRTPLHYAARYGHKNIADLLVRSGARAKNLSENYGDSPLLTQKIKGGDAFVWYLGQSGWAIKTEHRLLIFDYQTAGPVADEPRLANGTIDPEELEGQDVYVFVTHEHGDHFTPAIFDWKASLDGIQYILGFEPETSSEAVVLPPRTQKTIDGMEISTIASTDAGLGFLVKVDGLTIFHAGDHACKDRNLDEPYSAEIDYLADQCSRVDLAFLPISGCGFRDPEAVTQGIFYALKNLKPNVMFPMHWFGLEYQYGEFARKAGSGTTKTTFACAENKGDCFVYEDGILKR